MQTALYIYVHMDARVCMCVYVCVCVYTVHVAIEEAERRCRRIQLGSEESENVGTGSQIHSVGCIWSTDEFCGFNGVGVWAFHACWSH